MGGKNPRNRNVRGRRNTHVREKQHHHAAARESLERQWYSKIDFEPEMVPLVVHAETEEAPLHRWLPYRQGFSPMLVESWLESGELASGPVLDPFCGSGTTVVEAARLGREAVGVEVQPSLVFLTNLKLGHFGLAEEVSIPCESGELADLYAAARTPHERGAVLLAASRTVKGDGRPRKNLPPMHELVREMETLIAEDGAWSLPANGQVHCGTATELPFGDDSIGGILTSPPYLPRYDYVKVVKPMEVLLASGEGGQPMAAHRRAGARKWGNKMHGAVREVVDRLKQEERNKSAGMVRSYFDELERVVQECARVLEPGAPMTWVIAGATVDKVYVPSDLLLAAFCRSAGLEVEEIIQVRTFGGLRKLGNLQDVAPREIILSARKL
ncbi:MAG: DNA methyltransferase [Planctomycetota bacterium]|jgi:SAM-dependent methyltransferase